MACNLPIVSTRFGGLPDILDNQKWLRFVSDRKEMMSAVEEIKQLSLNSQSIPNTRELVSNLSWESIASQLRDIYEKLINARISSD